MIERITNFFVGAELWMNEHLQILNAPWFVPAALIALLIAIATKQIADNRKGKQ